MSYVGTFRQLLILQTVLTIAIPALAYYGLDKLPAELQHYLDSNQTTYPCSQWFSSLPETIIISLVISFAFILIINLIGLWLLKNWARHLYTSLTIVGFLIYALGYNTPTVTTGLETLSLDLLNILTGATIAMMYLPPLSQRFKAHSSKIV
jgi:H+/Cl- antiporter ClcA